MLPFTDARFTAHDRQRPNVIQIDKSILLQVITRYIEILEPNNCTKKDSKEHSEV